MRLWTMNRGTALSRRVLFKMLAGSAVGFAGPVFAGPKRDFPIGACDWTIGAMQNISAFDVGAKIGLEGLQVSFGAPGSEFDLRERQVRELYYKRSDETGIRIASLGMGILNKKPLATHPDAIDWIDNVIDVLAAMRKERQGAAPHICLLAFFGKGDINGKPEQIAAVIRKLKAVARKAEDSGVVLGIESNLSVDDHLRIIDGVGSNAIQVYYDSANSDRMGHNIYEDVVRIGGKQICEVHCKERNALLGQGKIDFVRFRNSLTKAGYKGWLIMEGSKPKAKKTDIVKVYRENFRLLDNVFRGAA